MDKNTTMLQLFQQFDEAINTVNELKPVMDGLKRTGETVESVTYTADDNVSIIGEVYYVKSSGDYVIQSEGYGKSSSVIREPKQLTILYEGTFDDTSESEILHLTLGDIVYFHASADNGRTESITLRQRNTLFESIVKKLDEASSQF